MQNKSDTPETDMYGGYCAEYHKINGMTLIQHARKLERERDQAREIASHYRWHALGEPTEARLKTMFPFVDREFFPWEKYHKQ